MAGKSDFLFGIRSVIEAIHSGKEIEKSISKERFTG